MLHKGLRQGCFMSPLLFNIIMREALAEKREISWSLVLRRKIQTVLTTFVSWLTIIRTCQETGQSCTSCSQERILNKFRKNESTANKQRYIQDLQNRRQCYRERGKVLLPTQEACGSSMDILNRIKSAKQAVLTIDEHLAVDPTINKCKNQDLQLKRIKIAVNLGTPYHVTLRL